MITQTELKTFIPAIVAPCILFYEAVTGNHVSESTGLALTNGIVIGSMFVVSCWGAWKNHQKTVEAKQKEEITKPKIPPDQGANIIEETQPVQPTTPIVTQTDLNQRIGG